MTKIFMLLIVAVWAYPTIANSSEHANHDYTGSHGMAVFEGPNGDVFVHHLPLYSKPHDYQIIYKVGVPHEVKSLVADNGLVTLLPENFDLSKLVNGESFTLASTVFAGHFERGGELAYSGDVEFIEPIFIRSLNDLETVSSAASFEHVWVDKDAHLVVHQIAPKPSFDTVAWLPVTKGESTNSTPSGTVTECKNVRMHPRRDSDIQQLVRRCFGVDPVYSELKDFQ